MKWEKIGNICELVTSGGTPLSSKEDYYYPKEIPWLKTAEVNYCRIYNTENYISKEGLLHSSAKIIPINSVIVAMYGQGDTAGRVAINKIPLTTNQACCNLVIDRAKANYEYVYYALSLLYNELVKLKNGGAQPNLNAKIIKDFEIPFPDINTQNRIADILSTYDNLIENNKKQIKLLEEAAQRLYKEWFVDLRFPGYENTKIVDGVPEGWRIGTVSEIGQFKRGKTITKSDVVEGEIPVVAGGLEPAYYHNEKNTTAPVITVSGSGANAGYTRMYYVDVFASDCSFLDSLSTPYLYFVYCFLKTNIKQINSLQKGSAQPHVYAKDINAMSIRIPDKPIITQFCDFVYPMFANIGIIKKQKKKAEKSRDMLLPRLMSGEVEV